MFVYIGVHISRENAFVIASTPIVLNKRMCFYFSYIPVNFFFTFFSVYFFIYLFLYPFFIPVFHVFFTVYSNQEPKSFVSFRSTTIASSNPPNYARETQFNNLIIYSPSPAFGTHGAFNEYNCHSSGSVFSWAARCGRFFKLTRCQVI